MKKRFCVEQIIKILEEAERSPDTIRDICSRHNIA